MTSSNGNSVAQKFKYNGKELEEDLGLNTYAYGWRDYDPAIGRFNKIDRFAGKYMDKTPYHYGGNNPISFVDIAGDSIIDITRSNGKILIQNSPKTKDGKNFTNTIVINKNVKISHVTDKSAGIVNDAMVAIEDNEVTVTSGYRSPEKQANAMYTNLQNKGIKHQKNLYGSSGDKVIDAYADAKGKTDKQGYKINGVAGIKSAMVDKINSIGPGNVSAHSNIPTVRNVFDIAPSSVSNVKGFQKAIRGKVSKLIPYPKDPAIHVEIKQ